MNAIELLKADHKRINELFTEISQTDSLSEKRGVFAQLQDELAMHTMLEETEFYPLFLGRPELNDLIEDSYDDHQEINDLLDELRTTESGVEFSDRVDDLIDCVLDHLEIEENELFPKAEEIMTERELSEIGDRMEEIRSPEREVAA